MRNIIIYYSQTGNTKKIAEAIHSGMSQSADKCDIAPLKEVNTRDLLKYDLVGLGSSVIDFQEPAVVTDFLNHMPSLKGKFGFTFCTHGTCPGEYIARMVKALRRKGLNVTGWNDWYGSVFIPYMPKPYYTDGHPDEIDLKEAEDFGTEIVERTRRISLGEVSLRPRLPAKKIYEKLYGSRVVLQDYPNYEKPSPQDWERVRPKLNLEKCRYPKCTICVENCPTGSIDHSKNPPISHHTCIPCQLWFCEQLCPTGAIEVDWGLLIKREKFLKTLFGDIAVSMKENKEIRRFRSLVSGEEGTDKPLYTINKHPRIILRDGVAKVHY